jgi:hypothetical protein
LNAEYGIPLFPAEAIPLILDTVLRYAALLRKTQETEREDALSDRLHKMLRKDKILRGAPFFPFREPQLFDDDAKAGQSGRIDINFLTLPGDDTYFAIEAKRLHVTFLSGWQSLVSEYVTGDQGMMCFVTGKYSRFQQAAAMLGYVFDGQVDKARTGIAAAVLKNAQTLRLAAPHQLQSSPVLSGDWVDETQHQLGARPFTIYHMLIPVS